MPSENMSVQYKNSNNALVEHLFVGMCWNVFCIIYERDGQTDQVRANASNANQLSEMCMLTVIYNAVYNVCTLSIHLSVWGIHVAPLQGNYSWPG